MFLLKSKMSDYNRQQHTYDRKYGNLSLNGPFKYPNMIEKYEPGDGSCLFNAVTDSFYLPYKAGYKIIDGKRVAFDKKTFIRNLRDDLADMLDKPVSKKHLELYPNYKEGVTYYEILSAGKLAEYAKESGLPEYSLEGMQAILRSNNFVDMVYQEYLGLMLDIDIYVLDRATGDIAAFRDFDFYRDRKSAVIIYNDLHYNLVGLNKQGIITTLFNHNDDFITSIRNRIATR